MNKKLTLNEPGIGNSSFFCQQVDITKKKSEKNPRLEKFVEKKRKVELERVPYLALRPLPEEKLAVSKPNTLYVLPGPKSGQKLWAF